MFEHEDESRLQCKERKCIVLEDIDLSSLSPPTNREREDQPHLDFDEDGAQTWSSRVYFYKPKLAAITYKTLNGKELEIKTRRKILNYA